MGNTYWRTYTGTQAIHVWSGLELLLRDKRLSSDEVKIAKSIQGRLRNAMDKEEGYTQVSFTDKEDAFLTHVEASLWR